MLADAPSNWILLCPPEKQARIGGTAVSLVAVRTVDIEISPGALFDRATDIRRMRRSRNDLR
jgi:hypothetical protein